MAKLKLAHLRIPKAKLELADPGDRLFYFQIGHIANEIVILRKFTIYAFTGSENANKTEQEARIAMALLAVRFTAGRLYEGNKVIHSQRNGRRLARLAEQVPFDTRIGTTFEDGIAAQRTIAAYFGRAGNLIGQIRNKLAFHSNPDELHSAFQALPPEDVLVDFLAAHMGDSFYGSAEILSQQVMIQLTGLSDLDEASAKIRDEPSDLAARSHRKGKMCWISSVAA